VRLKEVTAAMKEAPNGVFEHEVIVRGTEATEAAYSPPDALPSDRTPLETGQDERALCLRVLAAVLGEQAAQARVEQALALAQEVYELELEDASSGAYR
jgi:hypothetical protein